jgi:hypothetical protein
MGLESIRRLLEDLNMVEVKIEEGSVISRKIAFSNYQTID